MTRDEEREIERQCSRLIALYANLNDAGDWDAVAALYVEEGRMARPSDPDNWIEGRSAILEAFRARSPRKGRHICSNIVIDVIDENHARSECALTLFSEGAAPKVGSFHDIFVRSPDGWRFAERRGSTAY